VKVKSINITGFLFLFSLLVNFNLSAQTFNKGDLLFSFGGGVGNIPLSGLQSSHDNYHYIGPLYLKGERAVSNRIGLGLNLSYYHAEGDIYTYAGPIDSTSPPRPIDTTYGDLAEGYGILFRFNYHPVKSGIFDPYMGAGLGYRGGYEYIHHGGGGIEPLGPPLGFAFSIGTRIYMLNSLAAYFEIGIEKAALQAGFTYRLIHKQD
jgi:hypothetical protein